MDTLARHAPRAWLAARHAPRVLVEVREARGSVPREAGTRMLVSAERVRSAPSAAATSS